MTFRLIGILLVLMAGLAGCGLPRPPLPQAGEEESAWLSQLHSRGWRLHGRIGVSGERDSWHGSLRWEYHNGTDLLVLSGPFGQAGVVIQVQDGWIRIRYHDGRIGESSQPEVLLRKVLGVDVPLRALHYWVLGLPAPGSARPEYDSLGRLQRLYQYGWKIGYPFYLRVKPGVLPGKIILTGPQGVRLKLIVDHWETAIES